MEQHDRRQYGNRIPQTNSSQATPIEGKSDYYHSLFEGRVGRIKKVVEFPEKVRPGQLLLSANCPLACLLIIYPVETLADAPTK